MFHNKILAERTSQWGPAKQRGRELLEQLVEETLKIQQDPSRRDLAHKVVKLRLGFWLSMFQHPEGMATDRNSRELGQRNHSHHCGFALFLIPAHASIEYCAPSVRERLRNGHGRHRWTRCSDNRGAAFADLRGNGSCTLRMSSPSLQPVCRHGV